MKATIRSWLYRGAPFILIRLLASFVLTCSPAQFLTARLSEHWTDEQIFNKSDLVVIATMISSRDTDERSELPGIEPRIYAVGITTEFEICVVLKGAKTTSHFQLHHYKTDQDFTNGPELIEIPKGTHPTYLLFLVKENDGRYAPVTGQTDPSGSSVFRLLGANERGFAASEPAVLCEQGEVRQSTIRPVPSWTYKSLIDTADFVVTANWVSVKDTNAPSTLPTVERPVTVIGVTTEFEVSLVLKGPKGIKKFGVRHFRFQNAEDSLRVGSPKLVKIAVPVHGNGGREYPGAGKFLLFLKSESDGGYGPVTGQTEPALSSILQLLLAVKSDSESGKSDGD